MEKKANIRGDTLKGCPFGLSIPNGCLCVGKAIHRMAPVVNVENEETIQKLKKANNIVYAYYKTEERCPFADKVFEDYNKVDCNFGDTAQGMKSTPFIGSPLYPQTFHGIGLDGLYGFPLGFYADNNESRNLFFGLFSFLGHATVDELIKLAHEYDKCGENEKAGIINSLVEKLQSIKEEYKDTFEKIEKYLAEYRDKYESERTDTGLLWHLTDAWYGPRQTHR